MIIENVTIKDFVFNAISLLFEKSNNIENSPGRSAAG